MHSEKLQVAASTIRHLFACYNRFILLDLSPICIEWFIQSDYSSLSWMCGAHLCRTLFLKSSLPMQVVLVPLLRNFFDWRSQIPLLFQYCYHHEIFYLKDLIWTDYRHSSDRCALYHSELVSKNYPDFSGRCLCSCLDAFIGMMIYVARSSSLVDSSSYWHRDLDYQCSYLVSRTFHIHFIWHSESCLSMMLICEVQLQWIHQSVVLDFEKNSSRRQRFH